MNKLPDWLATHVAVATTSTNATADKRTGRTTRIVTTQSIYDHVGDMYCMTVNSDGVITLTPRNATTHNTTEDNA